MDKSTKYKFHFLELDKTGMGKKTVSSAEISKQYSDVEITLEEFIKAVITCGMPMYYLTPGITYSRRNEITYKLYALLTLLEFDSKNKYIKIRKEIKYLDASEKATLTYYLGMVMTKFISWNKYKQNYLVHLNILEKTNVVKYKHIHKKQRPDLVGYSVAGNCYSVFEAKGRLRKNVHTITKALEQVQNVNYIAGSQPQYAVAQLAYFKNDELYVVAVDPVEEGTKEIEFVEGMQDKYFELYYKPIIELFDGSSKVSVEEATRKAAFDINEIIFSLEIPDFIYRAVKERELSIETLWENLREQGGDLIKVALLE